MKKEKQNFFTKTRDALYTYLLPISILVILLLFFIDYKIDFKEWLVEKEIELEVYYIYVIVGAILTLFWADKRYRQSQKQYEYSLRQYQLLYAQYKQTEDNIFKNKLKTVYLEVVRLLSDDDAKEKSTATNLINGIGASIDTNDYLSKRGKKDVRVDILNFAGMNLRYVNLKGADLNGANFKGADLTRSDLRGAELIGANLFCANLEGVELVGVKLIGARLNGAELISANFKGSKLYGANFRGAKNIPDWIKAKLDKDGIYRDPLKKKKV